MSAVKGASGEKIRYERADEVGQHWPQEVPNERLSFYLCDNVTEVEPKGSMNDFVWGLACVSSCYCSCRQWRRSRFNYLARARARLHVSGLLGRKLCWRAQAGAQIYSGFIQVIQAQVDSQPLATQKHGRFYTATMVAIASPERAWIRSARGSEGRAALLLVHDEHQQVLAGSSRRVWSFSRVA